MAQRRLRSRAVECRDSSKQTGVGREMAEERIQRAEKWGVGLINRRQDRGVLRELEEAGSCRGKQGVTRNEERGKPINSPHLGVEPKRSVPQLGRLD